VDLYAYLSPGVVMFDDVELKDLGEIATTLPALK